MVAIELHNQLIRDRRVWDNLTRQMIEPSIAGEEIEEMAGTGVNVSTNKGRTGLPYDEPELV